MNERMNGYIISQTAGMLLYCVVQLDSFVLIDKYEWNIKELLFKKAQVALWTFDKCCLTQDTTQCWECNETAGA